MSVPIYLKRNQTCEYPITVKQSKHWREKFALYTDSGGSTDPTAVNLTGATWEFTAYDKNTGAEIFSVSTILAAELDTETGIYVSSATDGEFVVNIAPDESADVSDDDDDWVYEIAVTFPITTSEFEGEVRVLLQGRFRVVASIIG